jgi:hypothetical protein
MASSSGCHFIQSLSRRNSYSTPFIKDSNRRIRIEMMTKDSFVNLARFEFGTFTIVSVLSTYPSSILLVTWTQHPGHVQEVKACD